MGRSSASGRKNVYLRDSEAPKPQPCPNCQAILTGYTELADEPDKVPRKLTGLLTICCECAAYLMFTNEEGNLRKATGADLREFAAAEPELNALLFQLQQSTKQAIGNALLGGRRS